MATADRLKTEHQGGAADTLVAPRPLAEQRGAGASEAQDAGPFRQLPFLSTLINALPTPIFYKDRSGRYLGGNQAFESFVGRPLADIVGKTVYEMAPSELAAKYQEADAALFDNPGTQSYEASVLHADGSVREVIFNKSTFSNAGGEVAGIVGSILDITERRSVERRLADSDTQMMAIWKTIQTAVIVLEEDTQKIRDLNPAAEAMLNCQRDQVRGQDCETLDCRDAVDFGRLLDCRLPSENRDPVVLTCGDAERHVIRSATRTAIGNDRVCILSLLDVTELVQARTEVERSHLENAALIAGINSILIALSPDLRVTQWNGHAEQTFAKGAEETLGEHLFALGLNWDEKGLRRAIEQCRELGEVVRLDSFRFESVDGQGRLLGLHVSPIRYDIAGIGGVLIMGADITDRRLQETRTTQAQKLESIGQLAAGIAHEINTPTQYVGDNTRFLRDCFSDLMDVIQSCRHLLDGAKAISSLAGLVEEVEKRMSAADLEYLREEIPKAIEQTLEGVDRVSKIVRSMKEFSHPAMDQKAPVDLNRALESTLTVSRNEWKYCAELETDFAPDLPLVPCFAGELNQVFLNIIVNAAHAIEAVLSQEGDAKGKIRISTRRCADSVEVRIADTGGGIPESIRHRIFDPFFTTKEVGRGTGQGLAIAHQVVTEKHGGALEVDTRASLGTTFVIRLPTGSTA